MKNLSFYEQAGVVVPGAVFLFGLFIIQPDLHDILAKDGITIGGLGVFILLSYATGHLIAAVGNLLEAVLWWPFGGMPSNWVTEPKRSFLTEEQTTLLESRLRSRLQLGEIKVHGMPRAKWNKIFQQLYRDVLANNPGRSETFNGNYGLNRGLASSALALAVALPFLVAHYWPGIGALFVVCAVYLYRAYRFGVHFGREIFIRFLLLPPEPMNAPAKA